MRRLVALLSLSCSAPPSSDSVRPPRAFGERCQCLGTDLSRRVGGDPRNPRSQCYIAALDPVSYAAGRRWHIDEREWRRGVGQSARRGHRDREVRANDPQVPSGRRRVGQGAHVLVGRTERRVRQSAHAVHRIVPRRSVEMPVEMRNFEIASQAASLDLVAKLNATVPLDRRPSMQKYYTTHTSNYDTICVSVAVIAPAQLTAFNAAQSRGERRGSGEEVLGRPVGTKGWRLRLLRSVEQFLQRRAFRHAPTALDTFPTTPQQITYNNATADLFVAPTSRTATPFAQAESAVLSDLESPNASRRQHREGEHPATARRSRSTRRSVVGDSIPAVRTSSRPRCPPAAPWDRRPSRRSAPAPPPISDAGRSSRRARSR